MPSARSTINPYWRCEADEASHREDARRCQSCDYSLAGLPDRDGGVQCPECGHIDLPPAQSLQAARGRHTAAIAVAVLIAVLNGLMAMMFLRMAWWARRTGHPDYAAIDFTVAVLLLYAAVAAWFVPYRRYAFSRWASGCGAGSLGVWSVWSMPHWHILLVIPVGYNALVVAFLIHPEVSTWWLRLRKGTSQFVRDRCSQCSLPPQQNCPECGHGGHPVRLPSPGGLPHRRFALGTALLIAAVALMPLLAAAVAALLRL